MGITRFPVTHTRAGSHALYQPRRVLILLGTWFSEFKGVLGCHSLFHNLTFNGKIDESWMLSLKFLCILLGTFSRSFWEKDSWWPLECTSPAMNVPPCLHLPTPALHKFSCYNLTQFFPKPKLLRALALLDQEALDNIGMWLLACATLGTFCVHWHCLKHCSHTASEFEPLCPQTQCSNFILNSSSQKWPRKANSRIMRRAVFLEKL